MSHRWTLFRMPFELLYDVGPRWAVLYWTNYVIIYWCIALSCFPTWSLF